MQEKLLRYYSQHCSLFLENFNQALSGFDNEAVHDMRVAVKRLRAINLLLERLFPGKFDAVENEIKIRELFRISGRIRDTQVQQQLLSGYISQTGATFSGYQLYLKKVEQKSIKKFNKCLAETDAEEALRNMQKIASGLILASPDEAINLQIILFVSELMDSSRSMCQNQTHDENLHEIRRKLKQCHYLLSLFDKDDQNLLLLNLTVKKLDKVSELLGDWHDQVVAIEMLKKFINQASEKDISGFHRYLRLMNNFSGKRHMQHRKIMNYFEEKLDF